jgi:hypothetical protein
MPSYTFRYLKFIFTIETYFILFGNIFFKNFYITCTVPLEKLN